MSIRRHHRCLIRSAGASCRLLSGSMLAVSRPSRSRSTSGVGRKLSTGPFTKQYSESLGNQAVHGLMCDFDKLAMQETAAQKIEELFDILLIDHRNDHNTRDTPSRVAKMFVEETMRGRYTSPPRITDFDNVERCDQLIVTGPLEVRSTCAHHLMPIYGHAVIGILPSAEGKIIGLSKYDRIVDHFSSRLQIQEELVKQIERFIVDTTAPRGLAVRVSAVHMCKSHRGLRASRASRMVNTTYYGALGADPELKAEFLQECAMLERSAG